MTKSGKLSSCSPNLILNIIEKGPQPVARRLIAAALQIKGKDRVQLKFILKNMVLAGKIDQKGKSYTTPESYIFCDAVVTGLTTDGELLAESTQHKSSALLLNFLITGRHSDEKNPHSNYAPGDTLLVRYRDQILSNEQLITATVIKKYSRHDRKILGVLKIVDGHVTIDITDRRNRNHYHLSVTDIMNGQDGDLVEISVTNNDDPRNPDIKVIKVLGKYKDTLAPSFIALQDRQIPTHFSQLAIEQAEQALPPVLDKRHDLRHIPLVTIDDEDARDFDDAIWAEPDNDDKNSGGWRLLVAIADVSHYVKPGDTLDHEAFQRGNSVYLPDQVVPMLPEALSNTLCSLQPNQDRACLAVEMIINKRGKLIYHRFMRGLMRSTARLTYANVQAAYDGKSNIYEPEFVKTIIKPLYGAFQTLKINREFRGALNLELPEQRLKLNDQGQVASIQPRVHHDSHQLIEEFMVMANVAAAITLNERKIPTLYRIHDEPTPEKIHALIEYTRGLGLVFAKGQVIRPNVFNALLKQAIDTPHVHAVNTTVLRTQAQAVYSPHNIGHFGLGLARYCHFTSPIRRYADLIVHRGLIHSLRLDDEQTYPYTLDELGSVGEHISMTERRAAAAERETVERYVALYLEKHVGETFACRVAGLSDAGLFLLNPDTGVEGLVPMRTLPMDYYIYDRPNNKLIGRRRGLSFGLGQDVQAKLESCNPLTGGLLFSLIVEDDIKSKHHARRQSQRPGQKTSKSFYNNTKRKG